MKTWIQGYYGCRCHPFKSWEECHKFEKQKLEIGQRVKHRCQGWSGTVTKLYQDRKDFVFVTCDDRSNNNRGGQENVANLIPIGANHQ